MKVQATQMKIICALLLVVNSAAFTLPSSLSTASKVSTVSTAQKTSSLFPQPRSRCQQLSASSAALTPSSDSDNTNFDKNQFLSFKTKFGYLNPYAIYYGLTSILLGIPWFLALNVCQVIYKISNYKLDKLRRIPVLLSHLWGITLLKMTNSMPEVEGREILDKFYKENRAAMFVANHNAWMDIPFVGHAVGWKHNYKMVSKAELGKVPILGRSIKVGGHVMVDRTNRRSQIQTLKSGMQWLKDGCHLVTFPEGTRSKNGRLLPFKNGAFKMAHKVGAPIIPISIIRANKVHPTTWMFPCRSSHGICKVIVHDPVESKDKTEAELAEKVRSDIINGLPDAQKPLE